MYLYTVKPVFSCTRAEAAAEEEEEDGAIEDSALAPELLDRAAARSLAATNGTLGNTA